LDHFALEGDELAVAQRQKTLQRNFQGYSTRGGPTFMPLGCRPFSQADSIYWQNQKELPVYYGELDQGRRPIAKSYLLTEDAGFAE